MRSGVLVLVGVVLASSCGGAGPDPVEVLTRAPDRVESVGSVRMRFEVRVGGLPGTGAEPSPVARMDVAFDPEGDRWRTVVRDASGEGRVVCRIRAERGRAFGQVVADGDRSWVRLPMSEDSHAEDGLSSFVEDARSFLDGLREVGEDVETVGPEELGGVETTHYRFVTTADEGRVPFGFTEGIDARRLDHHAWIDGEGLPRRLLVQAEHEGEMPVQMDVVVDLSAFGEPVEVVIPPEGEVEATGPDAGFMRGCFGSAVPPLGQPPSGPTPSPSTADLSSMLFRVGNVADMMWVDLGTYEAISAEALADRVLGDVEIVHDAVVTEPGVVSFRAMGPDEIHLATVTPDGLCLGLRNLAEPSIGQRSTFQAELDVGDDPVCAPSLFSLEDFEG